MSLPANLTASYKIIIGAINSKVASGNFSSKDKELAKEALLNWTSKAQQFRSKPPKDSDLLWILSGEKPEVFQKYLSSVPEPELNELAQDPERLGLVIGNLQQKIGLPQGDSSEGIPAAPLMSSNVYGFKYDPQQQKLVMKFQGKGGYGQGPVYEYEGVPPFVASMIQQGAVSAKTTGRNKWGSWWKFKQPSIGASAYALLVKGGFNYRKISDQN